MDITLDELKIIAYKKGFDIILLEKDYLLTHLLYLLKDIEGMHFKGGTALNKLFLNHQRLSEDLDFSLTGNLKNIEKQIKDKLKGTVFYKVTHDKRVDKFTRLIAHYKFFYEDGTIFIDLNARAKILLNPKKIEIPHFYLEYIPKFKIDCLHKNEIIAEKVMATCQRYKPRDYFDLYYLIKKKIPISLSLVRKKFKAEGQLFSTGLIFKNTKKIFNQWNEDLFKLTKTRPSFSEVMATLKHFFKFRE